MLAIALLLAALAAPAEESHDATIHHSFDDVAKWVGVFDDPGRDAWQKPAAVLHAIGVEPGMTVADLGAGTGYFSVHLAKAVGSKGRVLAIDVEPKLVDYMKERAAKAHLAQLVPVLAPTDDPKLPQGGVDLVLIVDTWHHIDDRLHYLAKLAAGLKAGGRVAVVDFKKGDFPVGPPDAHKLTADAVAAEFVAAGWHEASHWDELLYQYVLVFTPPAASGGASIRPHVHDPLLSVEYPYRVGFPARADRLIGTDVLMGGGEFTVPQVEIPDDLAHSTGRLVVARGGRSALEHFHPKFPLCNPFRESAPIELAPQFIDGYLPE